MFFVFWLVNACLGRHSQCRYGFEMLENHQNSSFLWGQWDPHVRLTQSYSIILCDHKRLTNENVWIWLKSSRATSFWLLTSIWESLPNAKEFRQRVIPHVSEAHFGYTSFHKYVITIIRKCNKENTKWELNVTCSIFS